VHRFQAFGNNGSIDLAPMESGGHDDCVTLLFLLSAKESWQMTVREGDISLQKPWECAQANGSAGASAPGTSPVSPPIAASPAAPIPALPQIILDGVVIHALTEPQCVEHILSELGAGRGGAVVTPNVDHLRRNKRDLSFAAVLAEAELVVADGMPLVWASWLQGTPLPQRVAGSDLISSLCAAAASQKRSVYLLGGDPGTADAAAETLRSRYPQLKIAGVFCPPLGFEYDAAQRQQIIGMLKAAEPDIVCVGLGSPKQERLIDQMRYDLPKAWWLGVGVSFSFLCGTVRRAPIWMRRCGLEWVHRLSQEPRRLFKRYVVVGIPFAGSLLLRSAIRGIPNRLRGKRGPEISSAPRGFHNENTDRRETRIASTPGADESAPPVRIMHGPDIPIVPPPAALGRLRGLVLLGGSVRPGPLAAAVGRNVLDLPVGDGKTVLTRWLDQAAEVAKLVGLAELPVRLLVDQQAVEPVSGNGRCRIERDTSEYRGTGGLLANVAVDYQDDDLILVGNAAQVLLEPLFGLLTSLHQTGGAVSLVGHRDGTPSGLMLVTCRTLRLIPNVGFVDMKEQALPAIAEQYDVRVLQCRQPTGLPIRSLSDYVAALRALHRPADRPTPDEALAEDWKSTFAIVEPGATVAPSARVHDSVVLAGANVEAGAVLVRSVVAGGVIIRRDTKTVDECVAVTAASDK
jgi:N-acetylglucosaminyldiphosphoundecaprenol N-acetyl-beta-D-mannosaminyltransferase